MLTILARSVPHPLAIVAVVGVAALIAWLLPDALGTRTYVAAPAAESPAPAPVLELAPALDGTEPLEQPITLRPRLAGGIPDGFFVDEVREGSLFARMGLQAGDVMQSLHQLPEGELIRWVVHLERDGRPLRLSYSSTTKESEAVPPPAPRVIEGVLDKADSCNDGLDSISRLASGCRIVPAFENGRSVGFKLFSIRPCSVFAKAGLENGDVVRTINGRDLSTPEHALETFDALANADELVFDVTRRGEPLRLQIQILADGSVVGTPDSDSTDPLTSGEGR
jgi:hypothetical protein